MVGRFKHVVASKHSADGCFRFDVGKAAAMLLLLLLLLGMILWQSFQLPSRLKWLILGIET